jgi:PAS domain S-box-containing protein
MSKKAAGSTVEPAKASTASPRSEQEQALRKRAETTVLERFPASPDNLKGLRNRSQRSLHELQVHQIELEMQNEELRRTQQELEASRSRYFDLYDLAPVGYVTLSQQGLIVEANLTAAKLLGVARGVLVQRPLSHFVVPEDQDLSYLKFKEVFETGALQVWEMGLAREGASPVWTCVEAIAAQDPDGTYVCRAVMSDITEAKRARQELLNSYSRTTAILGSMSDGFHTFDRELRCTYVNPAAALMFHKTAEELLGKPLWELWPPATDLHFSAAFRRTISENIPVQVEAFYPEPLNAWFEISCYPSPEGLSMFFTDITQRRLLEEAREKTVRELESLVRERTVLLKEIHHRVKNNLTVIASLLNMTAESTASGEAKAALGDSQRRVHSMALIHEHLYGSGHLDRINFAKYARELVDGLYAALVAEPGRISLKVDVDPIEIGIERAVPCALILNELLTNAFKYAFPDGRTGEICVSLHEPETGPLVLSIEDDGIGLRAGRLTARDSKSLGFRIVGILTKQLGGSIEQLAGPGTRIVLRFMRAIAKDDG